MPLPWCTVVVAAVIAGVFFVPSLTAALTYLRPEVAAGQWWRALTGSFVHFSGRELMWNLAVLLPAGIWAERLLGWRARALYLAAPALIGAVIHFFLPDMLRFASASGLAAAFVAFLALAQLRFGAEDRWFWRTVLGLLALKIVAEALLATPLLSGSPDPTMRAVALVHLAGMAAGSITLSLRRRRR
jgi:rhomboid family GlyGly-CTERM serine protease